MSLMPAVKLGITTPKIETSGALQLLNRSHLRRICPSAAIFDSPSSVIP